MRGSGSGIGRKGWRESYNERDRERDREREREREREMFGVLLPRRSRNSAAAE
jgi:hypothetical protein